jgi:hypothetical protein
MEGQRRFVTFRGNFVKMIWAFMNILNVVHHDGISHNDLWKGHHVAFFTQQPIYCVHWCV